MRYAILTDTLSTGWVNDWVDCDGYPLTFTTELEALEALEDHFQECIMAVSDGFLDDMPNPNDFKIIEVNL
jgi:hypothetical protein